MKLLACIFALSLLLTEGRLLGTLTLGKSRCALLWSLALPLAAVSNVLLVFLCTVIGAKLSPLVLLGGHALVIATLLWLRSRRQISDDACPSIDLPPRPAVRQRRSYRICCTLLLTAIFSFSAIHALVLHSFSIDSFTNWTMRSRVSFEDRAIAFDRTEARGVAKPQYPILVHSLQIVVNQIGPWSDRAANAVTFLFSWTSLLAAFLMLRKLRGTDAALMGMTLVAGIPLMSIHLAQGYGDVHLTTYLMLSFLSLALFEQTGEVRWATLSGLCVLGALWTKSEGLYFGYLPWVAFGTLIAWRRGRMRPWRSLLAVPLFAFLPFLVFLQLKGYGLTPHDSDFSLAWHPEGVSMFFAALWELGSLGVTWILAPLAALLLLRHHRHPAIHASAFPALLWPLAIIAMNAVIYLATPNVAFLLNGQSFARQMMPASALVILALVLMVGTWPGNAERSHTV